MIAFDNVTNCTIDLDEYVCSNVGLILPIISEYTWPVGARTAAYFIGLMWCFMGTMIIADAFMCAIEKITSHTRKIRVAAPDQESGFEEIEVKVWNDTVANLTLMALGSSAPEIMLSVIELIGNKFKAGQLGPGTIVGSAAFNLLIIIGVCIISIPVGEVRVIKAIKVFAVTASFSVFAYVWLIIVLVASSPNYIELWEAILTLLFFPILVIIAYIADKDYCGKKKVDDSAVELGFASKMPWKKGQKYDVQPQDGDDKSMIQHEGRINEKRMREFIRDLKKLRPDLTEEDIAKLAAAKLQEEMPHDRAWYRISASRWLGGGQKVTPTLRDDLEDAMRGVYSALRHTDDLQGSEVHMGSQHDLSDHGNKAVIEFTATHSAVLESDGRVRIGIRRYGKLNNRVIFKIETIDGTAEADKDYIPIKQTIVFEKDETHKAVDIEIIDDNEWEPDEMFFVKIALDPHDPAYGITVLGSKSIHEVTIINDDEPGTFEFSKPSLLFKESCGKALIPIERLNGCDGKVVVSWKTEDMTAKTSKDYEGGEGTLVFEHGEVTKMLEIVIYDDQEPEKDECFKVELVGLDPSEGAKLGRVKKTIITIVNDDDFDGMVSRLVDLTNMNVDALRVDSATWAEQFQNAMNVNGGDVENASAADYIMHFVSFFWKVLFAIVPPPSLAGGIPAFVISISFIGLLTTFINDLASTFGCLVGLLPTVNAITFVALGTSLPDLFASKTAASMEKTADNSIGNVTGSNSVNVFLGLGISWVVGSSYWTAKGTMFHVPAGSLVFSVIIFSICACLCIGLLVMRRYVSAFGGELGGNRPLAWASFAFLCFLWLIYVLLSSLQAYEHFTVDL